MKLLIFAILYCAIIMNYKLNCTKATSKMFDLSIIIANKEVVKNNRNLVKTEEDILDNFKKAIVSIKSRSEVPFVGDTEDIIHSTGFIVDLENGLIITNRKSARISPSFVKIQFYDGTIKNGRILYTDSIVPFGIVQLEECNKNKSKSLENKSNLKKSNNENNNKTSLPYSQLKLGNTKTNFQHGSQVSIMGITSEGSYIKKTGKVINTNRNFSSRYGSLFQSSFDRVTNLSGSPVWNENNEVVGIHILATETTSYELKIDYVNNILDQIKNIKNERNLENNENYTNNQISKGDIGISLDLVILGIAKINYKLKQEIADEISQNLIKTGGPPEIIIIQNILSGSPSEGLLTPGDIIFKINDKIIGNDFLLIDQILNQNINKKITVTVSRNGKINTITIPKVENTQDSKIKKYISFSNSYFHDLTNIVKYFLFTNLEGVYLTYTNSGSPFSKVSIPNKDNKFNYILTHINSQKIKSLEDLIEFFKNNCNIESIYVEGVDFNQFTSKLTSDAVDLDFSNSLLEINTFNEQNLKWEVESIDLRKFCNEKGVKILDVGVEVINQNKNSTVNNSTMNNVNFNKNKFREETTIKLNNTDLNLTSNNISYLNSTTLNNEIWNNNSTETLNINLNITLNENNTNSIKSNFTFSQNNQNNSDFIYNKNDNLILMKRLKNQPKINKHISSSNINEDLEENLRISSKEVDNLDVQSPKKINKEKLLDSLKNDVGMLSKIHFKFKEKSSKINKLNKIIEHEKLINHTINENLHLDNNYTSKINITNNNDYYNNIKNSTIISDNRKEIKNKTMIDHLLLLNKFKI